MNLGEDLDDVVAAPENPSVYDHWIRARMGDAVGRVRKALDEYRFNDAASEIYAFTWDELCDWYLELVKGVLYGDESEAARRDARRTLVEMFGALARLAHPIMPFLTEEIWQRLPGAEGTVMVAEYPRVEDYPVDAAVLAEIRSLQDAINTVRRIRAESNIAPKVPLALVVEGPLHEVLIRHDAALANLANIHGLTAGTRPEGMVATGVVGESQIYIPLDDAIDLDAERERLERELSTAQNDVSFLEKRLSNTRYVERAPAHLVAETREKLTAVQAQRDRLAESLARLAD
jgi:valyl-tRNA synthetase